MTSNSGAKNYLAVKEVLKPFDEDNQPGASDWKAIDAVMEDLSFSLQDGYTIDDPRPEVEDQMWYVMRSPESIVMAAFVFQTFGDEEPTYFAEYILDEDKLGFGCEAYETNGRQLREIFALLPQEAREHLRERVTSIDPNFYADMIEELTGERPVLEAAP